MLSHITDRLTQIIEKKKLKTKIEQDIRQVNTNLEEKRSLLERLEGQLKKEQVDVDRLEGFSLSGLFYSVLGSREQQVERERQELLAAQLKYQQARRVIDGLLEDQARLEGQLRELQGVEGEYAALMAEKENQLRQSNPQVAGELIHLAQQIADRNAEKREIEEAISAAGEVHFSLERVIEALESAEGWGTWDMLGGGFLSTAVKHSRIDEAREAMRAVQVKMNRFTRELADVQQSTPLSIEIGGLESFADYFFDGLIVDWIVQSKIENSLEQARLAYDRIESAGGALRQLQSKTHTELQRLNERHAAIVETAGIE
ncbi:hypothetical protein LARV_03783 [Longilinea arvoryzae]|uniref:Uncharacterized protein n=1 Tax=Longilinea arvoryzae TaxID=360412 RepID=A0A0K8MXK0_9CHLR|nr:hypothetical protein [Longilinea arvoryzae]GAP15988.1 hypothetical protein LARV_03783 [Longilinea arvoryzae]